MNLMLEKHANKVMFAEFFYYNDFEDWMQCVGHDEERKNEQFAPTTFLQVLKKFQLDTPQMLW
jgi:hypothetical protein